MLVLPVFRPGRVMSPSRDIELIDNQGARLECHNPKFYKGLRVSVVTVSRVLRGVRVVWLVGPAEGACNDRSA